MEKNKIKYYLKTLLAFISANIILLFVHILIYYNIIAKEAIFNAKNILEFLTYPNLYFCILPLIIGYFIIYKVIIKKYKIDFLLYFILSLFVIIFYFGVCIDRYYPNSKLITFINEISLSKDLKKQNKDQKLLSDELKEYNSIEAVEDISIYLRDNKKNLIIGYNGFYSKYDRISKEEYDELFELAKNIDNYISEDYYTNNENEYKIITSSFYTYIEINEDFGYLVWTTSIIDNNKLLTNTFNNKIIIEKNYISFGEVLNSMLSSFTKIEYNDISLELNNDLIEPDKELDEYYNYVVTKDNLFSFTINYEGSLSIEDIRFEEKGNYEVHLEKIIGNTFTKVSNSVNFSVN